MEEIPVSLHEMLRRALTAQVELGMGEMIVDGDRPPSEVTLADEMETCVRKTTSTADLFETDENVQRMAQYDSVDAHFQAIRDCRLCSLAETRTNFVYGVGNTAADLMFIGEAPGRDEDLQGEPFVGRAGKLLDRILEAIKLSRQEIYIANILKCRPPNNRDPQPDEAANCLPHLLEQIALIKPKLICALGRIAAQILLQTSSPLGKMRGQWHEFEGVPMMVTYHPAALLRFPAYKKDTWADMQKLKKRYDKFVASP
ncbi:MAG: uracil-DNA glycosylase [bacterium]